MKFLFTHVTDRANTVTEWLPYDSAENYKPVNHCGPNLYNPGGFQYKFNDNGFRCDSFSLQSDIPIVFLGCSCTEGIGLPIEHTWSYQLLSKIRAHTGKNIPYWSLALGGAGVDTQANCLYWLSQKTDIKYIFGLLPPMSRREYCFESPDTIMWGPSTDTKNPISKLFADKHFSTFQDRRSLMLIDSIRKSSDAKILLSDWNSDTTEGYKDFPNLNFVPNTIRNIDLARDSMHYGPTYHKEFSSMVWNNAKHYF
jgi:hypothetical protein